MADHYGYYDHCGFCGVLVFEPTTCVECGEVTCTGCLARCPDCTEVLCPACVDFGEHTHAVAVSEAPVSVRLANGDDPRDVFAPGLAPTEAQ